eukprot:1766669-Amphidinium_carterae.1
MAKRAFELAQTALLEDSTHSWFWLHDAGHFWCCALCGMRSLNKELKFKIRGRPCVGGETHPVVLTHLRAGGRHDQMWYPGDLS